METTLDLKEDLHISANSKLADYVLMAELFNYPYNNSYPEKIREIQEYLTANIPASAEVMSRFVEFVNTSTLQEMQELFLRSFDVQAITTLDIGFILFGEDYKRGQLLVNLNREHREAGNICETELSDHLPNVLRLLPKMKDEDIRNEIALRLLIPAVVKMIDEFDNKKIEKKDEVYKKHLKTVIDYSATYRTVYQTLLQALFIALKNDFGYDPANAVGTGPQQTETNEFTCSGKSASCSCDSNTGDFSTNIETELNIEKQ